MFIDSHAHIDGPEFDEDRENVVDRAKTVGVARVLNVGTGDPHSENFERAIVLSNKYLLTALGTHPHDARLYDSAAESKTKRLLRENDRMVAWGEIGLDFHYDNSPRDVQQTVFASQVLAAQELDLPVIIHTREAEDETIQILKDNYSTARRRGVFHCFSGSLELARAAIDLGFYISFSGIITFKKAEDLRQVASYVPLDRILVETDCPFLAPIPFRGKRNEPAYVVEVAKCVAALRNADLDSFARQTSENFSKCFDVEI
jgi:TatD DNase family protein